MKNTSVKDTLRMLREKEGLTQEEMASRLHITRQAISRWEMGETEPGVETLKCISNVFHVSINTLLGSPRQLMCQCCGMPLTEDENISTEQDGTLNEDYCKWCYHDGTFTYTSAEGVIDACTQIMSEHGADARTIRMMLEKQIPQLSHWRAARAQKEAKEE